MDKLELLLFNVGHGLSLALIEKPAKYVTLFDLGSGSDFSPLVYLNQQRNLRPDILFITHPHADHISDVENSLINGMHPDYIFAQNYDWEDVKNREKENQRFLVDKFQILLSAIPRGYYQGRAELKYWSFSPEKAKEIFGESRYINNSSLFVIYKWKDFKIAITGDLETDAMEDFCDFDEFANYASDSNILIAPHHGHNQGFYSGWPNKIGKPNITLISIQAKDEHFAKGYQSSEFAKGIKNNSELRYTMTTRKYGSIQVNMYYVNGKPLWNFNSL